MKLEINNQLNHVRIHVVNFPLLRNSLSFRIALNNARRINLNAFNIINLNINLLALIFIAFVSACAVNRKVHFSIAFRNRFFRNLQVYLNLNGIDQF